MRVKKFEAKTMKEALQMVKNEMGPDAVILAARDHRKSFGLAGDGSVEVTAAVSEHTLHKKKFVESRLSTQAKQKFTDSSARAQKQMIEKVTDRRLRAANQAQQNAQEQENRMRPKEITSVSYIDIPDEDEYQNSVPRARRPSPPARQSNLRVGDLVIEDELSAAGSRYAPSATRERASQGGTQLSQQAPRQASVQAAGPAQAILNNPSPQRGSSAQVAEVAALKGEVERLQQLLEKMGRVPQSFVGTHPGADYGISYDLSFMFQKLSESGVQTERICEILEACAKELPPIQLKKPPMIDAWVARWLLNNIRVTPQPYHGRVHLFVGGAGSGKTSALVKMASQLVVKEKRKIAVLTTDSMKVGAVDQLKIYCQILNVPFAVVREPQDWEFLLGQLASVDHILVDFPGLQLRDLEEIHLLKALLPPASVAPICHFVASCTSKDTDALEVARRYKVSGYNDLIVTNLDQSAQHGLIYNLHRGTQLPLHSFGIGNRIPEDFEIATKERVVDLIFKLTKIRKGS